MDKFSFKITATATPTAKIIALIPGPYDCLSDTGGINYKDAAQIVAAGHSTVDYALDDGTFETGLTAAAMNSTFKIRQFLQHIAKHPVKLKEMIIQADNVDFYGKIMTVAKQCNPFRDVGKDTIDLNDSYSLMQERDSKIVVRDLDIWLNGQTLIYCEFDPSREIIITLKF